MDPRKYVLGFGSTELRPQEIKELVVEPTCVFKPVRLIIAPQLRSRVEKVVGFLGLVLENFIALFRSDVVFGWQLPPLFLASVLQLKIGSTEHFREDSMIPGELFGAHVMDLNLHFDVCKIGQRIVLRVRNCAKKKITFRAGLIGIIVD